MGRVQGSRPIPAASERSASLRTAVRAELERRARARHLVTHGDLAALVGLWTAGLASALAAIRSEDARRRRPEVSYLVVRVSTGLPSGVGPAGRDATIAVQEAVFKAWSGE